MQEEKNIFNSLTPEVLSSNKGVYNDALDYAFSNSNVKNIAITGIYGAGKSTVWRTYVKEKDIKNTITISLGTYTDFIEKDSEPIDNRVEKQIINQISSQIDMTKIPLSKYRFKGNKSSKEIVINTILTILFVLSIIIFLNKGNLELAKLIDNMQYMNTELFCLILFIIPVGWFLYNFYASNKFIFSKVNIKGAEVSNLKDVHTNEETALDKDIKEIVYLIKSSESKIVVFEDLDRYDDVTIFTKLRELNFLVNSRLKENEEATRFVYMLRDSLFVSKNRTKFFDFILPIIPFIDSQNSEAKLLELLENTQIKPSKNIIRQIAYYIDDMRLLKNIVNEYIVYSSEDNIKIKELNLKEDKLFALIVLKNIFPLEFDNLQEDSGYIYSLFETVEKLRKLRKEEIEKSKKEIENMIEFLKNRSENSVFEAMALLIPASVRVAYSNENWATYLKDWSENEEIDINVSYNNSSGGMNYNTFKEKYITNNEESQKFIEKFSIDNSSKIDSLYAKIDNLNLELKNLRLKSVSELLNSLGTEELDEIFKGNKENFDLQNFKIIDEPYFSIIRFLILESLIDETYCNYKGYFHLGSIGKNDQIFLMSLLSKECLDIFFQLDNPGEVFSRLEEKDFHRDGILNKSLLKYCLNNDKLKEIEIISSVIYKNNDIKIIDILSDFEDELVERYISIVFNYNHEILYFILEKCSANKDLRKNILLSLYSIKNANIDNLMIFNNIIEKNEFILSDVEDGRKLELFNNFIKADVKFIDLKLTGASLDVLRLIVSGKSYELSINNVMFITQRLVGRDVEINYYNLISVIYSNYTFVLINLSDIRKYIDNNFCAFIRMYIDEIKDNEQFENEQKEVIMILESELSIDYKLAYLKKSKSVITDISKMYKLLEHRELFDILFANDKVTFNNTNLNFYWANFEEYSEEFIKYINLNAKSNNKEVLKDCVGVCNVFINEPSITDEVFSLVLECSTEKINILDNNLSKERLSEITEKGMANLDYIENIKIIMDKGCYESLSKLLSDDMFTGVIEKIATEHELVDRITSDLIYALSNSSVDETEVVKIIKKYTEEILVKNINESKSYIIKYLLENKLSQNNVKDILNDFNNFKYKDIFVEEIYQQSLLNEEQFYLSVEFVDYVINSEFTNIEFKVFVVCKKIKEKKQLDKLPEWLRKISSLSIIPEIFNNKHPNYESLSSDEYEIINSLESIGVVSINEKIYLKPKVFDKYR